MSIEFKIGALRSMAAAWGISFNSLVAAVADTDVGGSAIVDAEADADAVRRLRWIRPAFSSEFVRCHCEAVEKDDCQCAATATADSRGSVRIVIPAEGEGWRVELHAPGMAIKPYLEAYLPRSEESALRVAGYLIRGEAVPRDSWKWI